MKGQLLAFGLLAILSSSICFSSQIIQQARPESDSSRTGTVAAINGMKTSRAAHTATLLKNGRVLIAGGFTEGEKSLASAEMFDPVAKNFSLAENMNVARAGHTATLLPDGKVLIAGGFNGDYLDSAEIFDPQTGKFTPAGKMTMPRSDHTAVLLDNGKVLFAGGVGTGYTFLADAEIYDPAKDTFTKTGKMTTARESQTATLLRNGKVLITGGHQGRRAAMVVYSSAEIYDPSTGTFAAASDLAIKRHKHEAVLLDDGRVLIVGGSDERDSQGAYNSSEIYDPQSNKFVIAGNMNLSHYKLQGAAVLLKNGKVLVAGGTDQAEVYDPKRNKFDIVAGKFESARLFATATLLQNGQVLIVGGYDHWVVVSSGAWIFEP